MTPLPTATRRGKAVVGIAVLGVLLGYWFGGRSLNAVVVPAAVLAAATFAYTTTLDPPAVTRDAPSTAHQGETHTMRLRVTAGDRSAPVSLADTVPRELDAPAVVHTTTGDDWTAYEVSLDARGVHRLGPLTVVATDPLGLWAQRFHVSDRHRITVYPRVHTLAETAALLADAIGVTNERDHFQGVREYRPGDPLRDVNWKASAKHPGGLAVTEYAGEGASDHVTVVAEANGARTDAVAEAAASIAVHLLDAGQRVELVTTDSVVSAGNGDPHRRRILETLARLDRGHVRSRHREDADVLVVAPPSGEHVEVTAGETTRRYAELVAAPEGVA